MQKVPVTSLFQNECGWDTNKMKELLWAPWSSLLPFHSSSHLSKYSPQYQGGLWCHDQQLLATQCSSCQGRLLSVGGWKYDRNSEMNHVIIQGPIYIIANHMSSLGFHQHYLLGLVFVVFSFDFQKTFLGSSLHIVINELYIQTWNGSEFSLSVESLFGHDSIGDGNVKRITPIFFSSYHASRKIK